MINQNGLSPLGREIPFLIKNPLFVVLKIWPRAL
jgi:hypothetical protein